MGVSKTRGGPSKCMVYNGKPYFLMDDLGGKPLFSGNPHMLVPKESRSMGPCVSDSFLPSVDRLDSLNQVFSGHPSEASFFQRSQAGR